MIIAIHGKKGSGKDTIAKILQFIDFCNMGYGGAKFSVESCVEYLEPTYNEVIFTDWKIRKFADKLKDIVCLLIGCTREQLEDGKFKEKELGEEWEKYYCRTKDRKIINYFNTLDEAKRICNEVGYVEYDRTEHEYGKERLTPRVLLQLMGTECGTKILHPNLWVNSIFKDYTPLQLWIITDLRFPNEFDACKSRNATMIKVVRPGSKFLDFHISETALDHLDNDKWDHVIVNDGSLEDLIRKVKKLNLV